MKRLALLLPLSLAACAPAAPYAPVIDPKGVSGAAYARDLAACQAIGAEAAQRYADEQAAQMMAGLIVGAVAGAAIGNAYGNTDFGAAYGAASGLASGAAAGGDGADGGKRIVDRCLSGRGYRVLSDLGRG